MPAFEFALPPGAKNIKIKTGTQEIAVEPIYYRHGKDGAIPIVALFGGDEFVGEVLEGQWLKGDDGDIQGPFTVKLNGSGKLEIAGKSYADGSWVQGWVSSQTKIPLLDDLTIDVHLKIDNLTVSNSIEFHFLISDRGAGEDPALGSNIFRLILAATTSNYRILVQKYTSGSWENLTDWIVKNSNEGTFRIKFEECKAGHGHTHIYYHEGAGDVNESEDELEDSPFQLDLSISSGYIGYRLASLTTEMHILSSNFVRVTYPDFKVVYDLDDDAYQGEGEELLKKAWDTSGNGNHGTVYNAKWVRIGSEKGLEFDGDDKVIISHSESLNLNELTVACRFKSTFSGAWFRALVTKFGDWPIEETWGLGWMDASRLGFFIRDASGTENKVYCNANEGLDGETHTIVGVASSSTVKVFLDSNKYEIDRTAGDIRNDRFISIGYHYGQYIQDTTVLEVLIYNRALSDDEVQQLIAGNPPTSGLVGEWKFDGGNNRGEVIVWDTMGSSDEDDWVRVYDPSHKFVGDCVVENGLVRVWINDGTIAGFQVYWWNGASWEEIDGYFAVQQQLWHQYKAITPYFVQINHLTVDEASVKIEMRHSTYSTYINVILERGTYSIKLDFRKSDASKITPEWANSDCVLGIVSGDTGVPLATLGKKTTTGQETDNFSFIFNTVDERLLGLAQTSKEGDMGTYSDGARLSEFMANKIWMTTLPQIVYLIVVPFSKVANLFMEAEDATLSGADSHDPDVGESDLVARLDAYDEYVAYQFTGISDLPKGRYIAFVRHYADGGDQTFTLRVYNTTDSKYLNEENEGVTVTAQNGAWNYTGIVFDITDDEDGDNIQVRAYQHNNPPDYPVYIDYFLIVPIGNGESWPQDIAHNAMRTLTKTKKIYPR